MRKRNIRSATRRKREIEGLMTGYTIRGCADPIDNARERNLKDAAEERR
jgi:hypothetical protein